MSIHTPELPNDHQPSDGTRNPKAEAKAAKAYAKATRPRYKKKRWWAAGLLLIIIIAAAAGGAGSDNSKPTASANTPQASQSEKPAAQEKPAAEKKPEMTSGQKNALESAQNYVEMSGFSKAGLIQQLSSSAGDGYSKADATFAANHVGADWNKEAVESAKNYLEITPMSKDGLIQQLSSSAGDKYTEAQARYAANEVY
jgi:hypothetical protein